MKRVRSVGHSDGRFVASCCSSEQAACFAESEVDAQSENKLSHVCFTRGSLRLVQQPTTSSQDHVMGGPVLPPSEPVALQAAPASAGAAAHKSAIPVINAP